MNLRDLIRVYEGVIGADECNTIIKEFEARKDIARLYDTPGYKFLQLELNQTDLLPLAHAFCHYLAPFIEDYFNSLKLASYVNATSFEAVRIKKYEKGGDFEFKPHIDAANKETAVRYLVFILYLNDNDGLTSFPTLGFSFKPRQGSVILFPPHWMFPHTGHAPTDTDKYIMMSCLHHT